MRQELGTTPTCRPTFAEPADPHYAWRAINAAPHLAAKKGPLSTATPSSFFGFSLLFISAGNDTHNLSPLTRPLSLQLCWSD